MKYIAEATVPLEARLEAESRREADNGGVEDVRMQKIMQASTACI